MLKHKLLSASAAVPPVFIEDVFSTYLYTGNGSTQTITNGIDLAGEGGMVWIKKRSGTDNHALLDTNRGVGKIISSNTTDAEFTAAASVTSFNSDGFNLGNYGWVNGGASTYASWTFRQAERFFDVVTYTGDGVAGRQIPHNLGTTVGTIIVKKTNDVGDWGVFHRSIGGTGAVYLSLTSSTITSDAFWNNTSPTDAVFTVGASAVVNQSGATYVAYLFAHDPLGPSGDGSDGLIACGSFTTDGSGNATVDLGWEPQWILTKKTNSTGDWTILDSMRGFPTLGLDNNKLYPNTSGAEVGGSSFGGSPDASGFKWFNDLSSQTYIYIAIRRGPMREPTSGTEVFAVQNGRTATNGTATQNTYTSGFPVDMFIEANKSSGIDAVFDKIRKASFRTDSTAAESAGSFNQFDDMDGLYGDPSFGSVGAASNLVAYMFRRAPGFFDVVAYTGDGVAGRTVSHNLGVAPEMMIVKRRDSSTAGGWNCYHSALGETKVIFLQSTNAASTNTVWNNTAPTATLFTLDGSGVNNSSPYIAYLFATLPGVSKVGSYTGNGSSQTINCGFTGGARFVLIKRTDSTGDWLVGDTARGIVAGNDPYLELNTTAAEDTDEDWLDPDSSGFIVNETSTANANVSSASYIYLAIA